MALQPFLTQLGTLVREGVAADAQAFTDDAVNALDYLLSELVRVWIVNRDTNSRVGSGITFGERDTAKIGTTKDPLFEGLVLNYRSTVVEMKPRLLDTLEKVWRGRPGPRAVVDAALGAPEAQQVLASELRRLEGEGLSGLGAEPGDARGFADRAVERVVGHLDLLFTRADLSASGYPLTAQRRRRSGDHTDRYEHAYFWFLDALRRGLEGWAVLNGVATPRGFPEGTGDYVFRPTNDQLERPREFGLPEALLGWEVWRLGALVRREIRAAAARGPGITVEEFEQQETDADLVRTLVLTGVQSSLNWEVSNDQVRYGRGYRPLGPFEWPEDAY